MNLFLYGMSLLMLFFLGVPIGFGLILSSIFYVLFLSDINPIVLPIKMVGGLNSFSLLAIVFYLLLGEMMTRSGITGHLVDLANALVGHIRGGFAQVTVVTNMFMGGISGSATADCAAVGSVMIPAMKKEGYSAGFAAALNASAATVGPIIPPSVPFIIYGSISNVSVGRLFLAGAIPGIIVGVYLMIFCWLTAGRKGYAGTLKRFSLKTLGEGLKGGSLPLLIPLIIVVGVVGGVFTPTESGAVASIVVVILGLVIYRQLGWRGMLESVRGTVHVLGSVLIIVAGAAGFAWILSYEGAAQMVADALTEVSQNPLVIMAIINGILLVLGCFVEVIAIIMLTTPIFLPIAMNVGYDPVHFGVILVLNVIIGMVTPPLGTSIFITCGIARISTDEFMKSMFPLYIPLLLGLLTTILFPQVVMFLPNLLMPVR